MSNLDLNCYGISVENVLRNPTPPQLYELALKYDPKATIASTGALATISYERMGRSPSDKRVVDNPESTNDVWWGSVNKPISEDGFQTNRARAIEFLNKQDRLYVIDGFAGWDPENRIKVRIICCREYHALFMRNMLIRPTVEELEAFGEPDYVVFNAGQCDADPNNDTVAAPKPPLKSVVSVALNFEQNEFVILGSQYAGEMKKGVFTIMNYLMPKKGILSMHCSANEGPEGDVSLFFGLSGTGKTTLSTEAHRQLIGDDEHYWTEDGVVNIEGGCYAKAIDLSKESEPEIYNAIRFGTILENTIYKDDDTREVDYTDGSLTKNTRASYPIEHIDNMKIPCVGGHPKNIVLLTCDAFGVLPPVSRLTPEQAMYHYISGYTAKVAGAVVGVTDPIPDFSSCFGAAFLVWHPSKYAELLAENMRKYGSKAWLVNTGWNGGYSTTDASDPNKGDRLSIKHTRALIDAIHSGALDSCETTTDALFGLSIPVAAPNVPTEILNPKNAWTDKAAYDAQAKKLAGMFRENFLQFQEGCSQEIIDAGPVDPESVGEI